MKENEFKLSLEMNHDKLTNISILNKRKKIGYEHFINVEISFIANLYNFEIQRKARLLKCALDILGCTISYVIYEKKILFNVYYNTKEWSLYALTEIIAKRIQECLLLEDNLDNL